MERYTSIVFAAILVILMSSSVLAQETSVLKKIITGSTVTVGETTQITAVFSNNGDSSFHAKFKGEIQMDKRVVEIIESEYLEVGPHETANLIASFTPKDIGIYEVVGYVVYSQKTTPQKRVIITVLSGSDVAPSGNMTVPLIVDGLLALLIAAFVFISRRWR